MDQTNAQGQTIERLINEVPEKGKEAHSNNRVTAYEIILDLCSIIIYQPKIKDLKKGIAIVNANAELEYTGGEKGLIEVLSHKVYKTNPPKESQLTCKKLLRAKGLKGERKLTDQDYQNFNNFLEYASNKLLD